MTGREVVPTAGTWEVMAHYLPATTPGADEIVVLPAGWMPLNVAAVGEFLVVVCYRESV